MGRQARNVKGGYPDHGNGYFCSEKIISYAQWLDLNRTQRIHKNFLEQLASVVILTLVSGFYVPLISMVTAIIYGLSRIVYMLPNRVPGVILGNICIAILGLAALYSSLKLMYDIN